MKTVYSFLMLAFLVISPSMAFDNVWYSHPNSNLANGRFTSSVQYQMFVNQQTGQTFIRLGNPTGVYLYCALYSNSGAYYAVSLIPPEQNVSQWYPIGQYGINWDYACN